MVLVPEDVLDRYEQKQEIETSPITSNMMHQDTAMSEILQSTDMSDVEKQKLYNANMESYLSLKRQKDDHLTYCSDCTGCGTEVQRESAFI